MPRANLISNSQALDHRSKIGKEVDRKLVVCPLWLSFNLEDK